MATSGRRIVPPEPPADLASISIPAADTPATWYRITRFPSPVFWSRKGIYRFDSADAKWGVCYAAESVSAAFQEIWGDELRRGRRVDWLDLEPMRVWQIDVPDLRTIELAGETLSLLKATLQCFVGGYGLSQRWGAALMTHPGDYDGLLYLGRRCGRRCLALFGDDRAPRPHQAALETTNLGSLVTWKGLWPFLDRIQVRVGNLPSTAPRGTWA